MVCLVEMSKYYFIGMLFMSHREEIIHLNITSPGSWLTGFSEGGHYLHAHKDMVDMDDMEI